MSNSAEFQHLLIPTLDGRRADDGLGGSTNGQRKSGTPIVPNFRSRSELRDGVTNTGESPRSAANHESFHTSDLYVQQEDEEDEHDLMMISLGNLDMNTGPKANLQADDIFTACKVGDEVFVRNAIAFDPQVIHEEQQGRTPLCLASFSGHQDIMRLLLEAGATDHDGNAYICALNDECRQILNQYHAKRVLASTITRSPSFKSSSSVHSASHRSSVANHSPAYLGPSGGDNKSFDVMSEVQLTPVLKRDHSLAYITPDQSSMMARRRSLSREPRYATPDVPGTSSSKRSVSREPTRRRSLGSVKSSRSREMEQGYETDSEDRAYFCGYPSSSKATVDDVHTSICTMGSDFIMALASYSLGCCAEDDWITREPVKAPVIPDEDSSIAKAEESVLDTEESESLCESFGESIESEPEMNMLEHSLSFKEVAEITLAETRDSLDLLKAHILGLYAKHMTKNEAEKRSVEAPVKQQKGIKRLFKRNGRIDEKQVATEEKGTEEKGKVKLPATQSNGQNDKGGADQNSRSVYRKKSVMDKKGVFSVLRLLRSKQNDSQQKSGKEEPPMTEKKVKGESSGTKGDASGTKGDASGTKGDTSAPGVKITVVDKTKDSVGSRRLTDQQLEEIETKKSRRWWFRQQDVEIDNIKAVKGRRRKRKSRDNEADDDTLEADQSASSLEVYEIMTPLSLSDMAEVTYDETKKNLLSLQSTLCGAVA